ncbi:MAG: radical SAM protein [Candidatus Woesearchaeota archaeon]
MEKLFNIAKKDMRCNTSYPLTRDLWSEYKQIEYSIDLSKTDKLSLYIHIPFCNNLCKFCEYTKFKGVSSNKQRAYLENINKQISAFSFNGTVVGFDVGGGTPTALSLENLQYLVDICKKIKVDNQYEKSIEASFDTITKEKIKVIAQYFDRISFGMQTFSHKVLSANNRIVNKISKMKEIIHYCRKKGLKTNIDLMYGLKGLDEYDLKITSNIVKKIAPNQITVYEMRYNAVNDENPFSRVEMLQQYQNVYNELSQVYPFHRFGRNTFSDSDDQGVSSYIKYRMEGTSYLGFGISAQSFIVEDNLLRYNRGKNITDFKQATSSNGDIYKLTNEEVIAKYVAISLYFSMINLEKLNNKY